MGHRWITTYLVSFTIFVIFIGGRSFTDPIAQHTSPDPTKRSSGAVALTPDGLTLLAANPNSNSITLIDTATNTTLAEIIVGTDPRTISVDNNGELAYVANRGSDTISIIDLDTRQQINQVSVGYRPYGVLLSPDGGRLYVTESGSDRLRCLDTDTLETTALIETSDRPSGLAIDNNGEALYLSHLLNNKISVVYLNPKTIYLPLVMRSNTSEPEKSRDTAVQELLSSTDFNLITTITLWPDSNLVQSIILSPDDLFAYVPHTRSNTGNNALTFDTTVFPLISIIDLSTKEHLLGAQFDLGTLDPPGVGLPFDAAMTPDGEQIWVLNAASNDISVINLSTRQLAAHIEVSDNPRGIVISPDGAKAYVNNTLAGNISVIDTTAYTVTNTILTTQIPMPPLLLRGKQLFHTSDDPRLSNAQWISCNTCHFEGEHDGRTWFFGFAGPRNTTSLLGMVETYPLRWSGEWDESADSEFANRRENFGGGLIDGEINCSLSPPDCVNHPPNQGRNDDLDALAAYIDSLQVRPSPNHRNGEPLSEAELRGQDIFQRSRPGMHSLPPDTLVYRLTIARCRYVDR